MNLFTKFIMGQMLLMDKAGEGGAGGGGGGTGGDKGDKGGDKGDQGDKGGASTVTLTKEQFDAIMARLPKEGGDKGGKDDDDLATKAAKEREAKDKETASTAKLEKAIRFTSGLPDFLKTNATLLPKSIEGIVAQAEKEKYENAVDKADAVKVAVVSEFFAVQANLDLLTESQKNALAEFQALTKNVKQERVQQVYDMVFEPAFETLKRVTKAKQVRDGEVDPGNARAAYAKRMAELSKAKFSRKGAK